MIEPLYNNNHTFSVIYSSVGDLETVIKTLDTSVSSLGVFLGDGTKVSKSSTLHSIVDNTILLKYGDHAIEMTGATSNTKGF